MSKEIKIVREAPTLVYKVTKVTGGRSPKTEVTVRIGGDVSKVAKDIDNNLVKTLLETLRGTIKEELKAWDE